MKSEPLYFLKVGRLSLLASEELLRRVKAGEPLVQVELELYGREGKLIPGQPDEDNTSTPAQSPAQRNTG